MRRWFLLLALLGLCVGIAQAAGRVRVACVGNSITFGYGLADREADSYPSQLQAMLGEDYEVGNFGHSGTTLLYKGHRPYVLQTEFRQALDFKPDIVVIHLGINDTDPRNWPNHRDDFLSDYCALIDSFRLVSPRVRIIVARLSPISHRHPRFRSGTRDWLDEIQQAIPLVAKARDAELIDFHSPLYHRPDLFPDGLHPNRDGAEIMARTVFQHITGNYGGLRLPPIYSDGMVLQRDTPLRISGTANAGDEVWLEIRGRKTRCRAGQDGSWTAELQPLKAGGPYIFTARTKSQRVEYRDVMVGEVWLCSGQSNMAFKLRSALERDKALQEMPDSKPMLRLYNPSPICSIFDVEWDSLTLSRVNQLNYFGETRWQACTAESAADFSAVAFFFGRMLQDSLRVPVGLICNAVGGSNTESWIDRSTLEHQFPDILTDWLGNDFIMDWCRSRAAKNISLALQKGQKLQRHPYEPCYMHEAGILPLSRFPIRGVIWYQGESNAHNVQAHEKLFPLLVGSWRENWKQPEMPFLFVQLSSIDRPSWPWFRDSQRRLAAQVPCTAMAVSSDMGDSIDVHPRRKQPVGERLARLALSDVYALPYFQDHPSAKQGPVIKRVEAGRKGLVLEFDCAEGLTSSDGQPLRTFELADEFGIFHAATAEVEGTHVIVSAKEVKHPSAVRYGWQPFSRANLVNAYGLPCSTFCESVTAFGGATEVPGGDIRHDLQQKKPKYTQI